MVAAQRVKDTGFENQQIWNQALAQLLSDSENLGQVTSRC